MQTRFIKGFKPKFIKQMALLMSICYLMNPLQQQINTVLHNISHGLELPNSVLSHKANSTTEAQEIHVAHEHDRTAAEHEHLLIDFIASIFEASNQENDSDNSQLVEVKWDKHISVYQFKLPDSFVFNMNTCFYSLEKRLKKGYSKKRKEPPQKWLG